MRAACVGVAVVAFATPARGEPACAARGVVADRAEPRTARALEAALAERGVADKGTAWVGKLASVGGGERDTIVFVPTTLDRDRPVEVIVFMDGLGSFAKRTIDRRHAPAIAAIVETGANAVYVSPDGPASAVGDDAAFGAYWRAGCARKRCQKDDRPPIGDFVALVADVTARVDELCGPAAAPAWQLDLVGFSGGGRGVREAVEQVTKQSRDPRLAGVALHKIVFADATYSSSWARVAWQRARDLAGLVEVTLLVQAGELDKHETAPGHASRWRAWQQLVAEARRARVEVTVDGDAAAVGKLRLRRVALCHHRLGDAAHEAVLPPRSGAPVAATAWSARDRAGTHRCRRGGKRHAP